MVSDSPGSKQAEFWAQSKSDPRLSTRGSKLAGRAGEGTGTGMGIAQTNRELEALVANTYKQSQVWHGELGRLKTGLVSTQEPTSITPQVTVRQTECSSIKTRMLKWDQQLSWNRSVTRYWHFPVHAWSLHHSSLANQYGQRSWTWKKKVKMSAPIREHGEVSFVLLRGPLLMAFVCFKWVLHFHTRQGI